MKADNPARILVVDDESAHLQALVLSLRDRGYETLGCASGPEALAVLQQQPFALLLTDLMMPEMDGVTLISKALKVDPHLACILMTGMGTIETAVKGMKAGALDYILKPFKLNTLVPVIERALKHRALHLENYELKSTVAIHELNQAIANTMDPAVLLDRIADAALAQFDADEASVMLVDDAGENLHVAAVRGPGRESLVGYCMPVGKGIAGWVALNRDPQVIEGVASDPQIQPVCPRAEIQSALSIPMISRNRLIGVLNVNCVHRRGAFSPGQIKALNIFTNAAASGIEAARLYEAQRKADGRYREVLDMVADAIICCDDEMRIVVFNEAAVRIFGHAAHDVQGKQLDVLLPEGLHLLHRQHMADFDADQSVLRGFVERRRMYGRCSDGSLIPMEAGISKRMENGKALYTAVVRDITLRLKQEEQIERLTRLYSVLSAVNATTARVSDEQTIYEEICRIAIDKGRFRLALVGTVDSITHELVILAHSGNEVPEKHFPIAPETPGAQGSLARTIRTGMVTWDNNADACVLESCSTQQQAEADRCSVAYLPFIVDKSVCAVMLILANGIGAFGEEEVLLLREMAGDVSFALDHIAKTRHLEYLASHDLLTGLLNRSLFFDRLMQAVSTSQDTSFPLAVILMDIDRFRYINDTFGRQGGDDLLRHLAERLLKNIPERANLARIGPDVFAAMHRNFAQAADIVRLLQNSMEAVLNEPFKLGDQNIHIAARVGVAFFPVDGVDADTLLKNADAALGRAKSQNERIVMYTADLNARVAERLSMESKLRGALERGEFLLHYQPKVDLISGQVTGLEALLRWQDPQQGLVPPDRFIGLLEDTGLIFQVGSWVMQEAARTASALHAGGIDVRIAVNVSPVQLRDSAFGDSVQAAIGLSRTTTHGLDLEITESVIMHDIEANVRKLAQIREMQVGLAIDDFGTGYSSLAYIARLPVQLIKIDRAFIRNLCTDPDSAAIVQTIISLTHALKMKVVAEGVETSGQADVLREMHCDYCQGYLYSRPLPLGQIQDLLRASAIPLRKPGHKSPGSQKSP